jgi:hypothetical protein
MSIIPFWCEPPPTPSRRFFKGFAVVVLMLSTAFTVGYGLLAWHRPEGEAAAAAQPAFLAVGGIFVLVSLGLVIYAWRFAPADLGRQQLSPLVRSGQAAPRRRDLHDV